MDLDSKEIHHAMVEGMEEENNCLRFFLMGKTGSGKSATGNSILGADRFLSEASLKSVTTDVDIQEAVCGDHRVKVMDSPGLFDTEHSEAEVAAVLVKAVATLHPGPHVLLFVVRFGRYTAEDHAVYTRLKALLDDRIKQHTIVIFTHADDLNPTQVQSIQQIISGGPENLKQLMADCGNRFVLFNNHADDNGRQSQVADLMDKVLALKNDNEQKPYQCPRYAYVTEKIEEETRKRLEEVEKLELERSQHYRRLEEQLRQKDQELEEKEQALDRRARELERQEQEEVKRLLDRIKVLEQQLQSNQNPQTGSAGSQQPGGGIPDPRVAAYEQHIAQLKNEVQNLQQHLATERQTIDNKQHVEINILAEKKKLEEELKELREVHTQEDNEKKELQAKLQELENNHSQSDEEKKKLREELAKLKRKDEQNDEIAATLAQQQALIEQLQKSLKVNEDRQNKEQRQREQALAEAERQVKEYEDQLWQKNQTKSGVCVIL